MQFRRATRADLPALIALLADDELAAERAYPTSVTPELERAWEAVDADDNNDIYVAEDDGRLVASLQLTIIPGLTFGGVPRAQVEAVRVASSHRGSGIGRQLIGHVAGGARERGAGLMQLMCEKRRERAHRFYESLGFAGTHTGFKRKL
jgi:GNAT superfamily N-acetyltransferase